MEILLRNRFFSNEKVQDKNLAFMAIVFFPATLLTLTLDSRYFTETFFDAANLCTVLVIVFFLLFYWYADSRLRKLMFIMVFLSFGGELLFCKVFGMYEYLRLNIPVDVPLGHALVYASVYVLSKTAWAKRNLKLTKIAFPIIIAVTFIFGAIFLNDIFSLIFGSLLFLVFWRKKGQPLYYYVTFCVFYIEIIGTRFECWTWVPKIFNVILSANPPLGAVFFYICGDVILAKLTDLWEKKIR